MSCRHDLALGTCSRCWPSTGTVEPGPEEGYEENLEGPGAVTADDYRRVRENRKSSTMHQLTVPCGHPGCSEVVSQWNQCPVQACSLDLGYCQTHGGRTRAESEMRLHVLGHEPQPSPSTSSDEPT
jgi:hypothetical protein